ncbi:uncharacterized protein LOC144162152 [Haemaphysalis longicornis]
MQCLRSHGEGHVRRECEVPRRSRCRRFGHTDTHCLRLYASVVGPAGTDAATEYIMDAAEAAEAAKGSGDMAPEEAAAGTTDEANAAAGGGDSGATGKPVDSGDLSKDGVIRTDDHLTASQNPDAMEVTGMPVPKRAHVDVAEGDANNLTAQDDEPPMKATPGRRSTTRLKTNV